MAYVDKIEKELEENITTIKRLEEEKEQNKIEILKIKKLESKILDERNKITELENKIKLKDVQIYEGAFKVGRKKFIFSVLINCIFIITLIVLFTELNGTHNSLEQYREDYYNADEELSDIEEKLSGLSRFFSTPLIATNIEMSNVLDGDIIDGDMEEYEYDDIKHMHVSFKLLKLDNEYDFSDGKVYIKFIEPDGTLQQYSNSESPTGYTDSEDVDFSHEIDSNIGNEDGGIFDFGTHQVEIYFEDELIGRINFDVV